MCALGALVFALAGGITAVQNLHRVELLHGVEAEGRLLVVGELAAQQRYAIPVAAAEQKRNAPVIGIDREPMAVGERTCERMRGTA